MGCSIRSGGCGAVTHGDGADCARRWASDLAEGAGGGDFVRSGGQAVGVRTCAATLQADAVVVNADFARGDASAWFPTGSGGSGPSGKIAKQGYSCSTFMMYLGIEGRYDDVAHHTIFSGERLSAESAGH